MRLDILSLFHEIPHAESDLCRRLIGGVNLQVPPGRVDLAPGAFYGLGARLGGEVVFLAEAVGGGDQPRRGDEGGRAGQARFLLGIF